MKLKRIPFFLILLFAACQSPGESESATDGQAEESQPDSESSSPETTDNLWLAAIQNDSEGLAALYFPEALHINPQGEVIQGADKVAKYWQNFPENIDSVYMSGKAMAGKEENYAYELGGFFTESGAEYRHLLVWNLKNETPQRELEFVAPAQEGTWEQEAIDTRRRRWVELCNAHQAQVLVDSVYTENALYYNHRPLDIGRAAIGKTYGYMNNPEYSLDLKPLLVDRVSEDLSLEIGQCSGSYGGKYVIVWQKNTDGVWRVLLDTNI